MGTNFSSFPIVPPVFFRYLAGLDPSITTVKSVMVKNVLSIPGDEARDEAAAFMLEKQTHHAIVSGENGKFVRPSKP